MWSGVPKSWLLSSVILWVTVIALAKPVFAEDLQVFANQYVVDYHPTSAALTTSDFSTAQAPVQVIKPLGSGSQAVLLTTRPRKAAFGSSIQSENSLVNYDPALDECVSLLKNSIVASCSPNYAVKAYNVSANDPQVSSLWGLGASAGINAAEGWEISTGSPDVVVAITDTGIDYNHPDLAANIWTNPGEIPGNNIDDDNNGYIDDVHGMSAIGRTGDPMDDNGHGTHCAGTIGAVGNNRIGVAGVNWNVKMMGLKFLPASGKGGSLAAAIETIYYMIEMKRRGVNVRVSSNSWGGGGYSESLATAIKKANEAGIIVVAAAGNEANNNDQNPAYPASYDGVVSVAAIDQDHNLAAFSNYGESNVDIAAPGVDIYSTFLNGGYATKSGTSMAAPHVSGALALLLAANKSMSAGQAVERLYKSGLPLVSLDGVVHTARMLELGRLMKNETAPLPAPTPTPVPCGYTAGAIPYSTDAAVENAPMLLQGDELNFQRVELPFKFPFAGMNRSAITISPNGVIYIGSKPVTMDFQNGETAPLLSIAALHADLIMEGSLGARVVVENDKASVYWLAEQYNMRGKGQIGIRAVIHQSGIVETFLSFSTREIQSYMQNRATMGISGPSNEFSRTFAYNNSQIRDGQAVRYTPLCGPGSNPSPTVTLKSMNVRDPKTRTRSLIPGKPFEVIIQATGTGTNTVSLDVALDGKLCQARAVASIAPGRVQIKGRLPRVAGYFGAVTLMSNGAKGQARIDSKLSSSKMRTASFGDTCQAIVRSLLKSAGS